jgi:hypothetical protein
MQHLLVGKYQMGVCEVFGKRLPVGGIDYYELFATSARIAFNRGEILRLKRDV